MLRESVCLIPYWGLSGISSSGAGGEIYSKNNGIFTGTYFIKAVQDKKKQISFSVQKSVFYENNRKFVSSRI